MPLIYAITALRHIKRESANLCPPTMPCHDRLRENLIAGLGVPVTTVATASNESTKMSSTVCTTPLTGPIMATTAAAIFGESLGGAKNHNTDSYNRLYPSPFRTFIMRAPLTSISMVEAAAETEQESPNAAATIDPDPHLPMGVAAVETAVPVGVVVGLLLSNATISTFN